MDNISNLSSARNITNALESINEKFIIQQWALIYNIYVMPLRSIKSEGIILKEKNIFQVITNIILSTIHYCKDLGALPQTPQNFNRSELCFAKRLCRRIMVSILLRKTVYCQNFATQNRLQRQRSSLFLTAPFSSGCILCGSLF